MAPASKLRSALAPAKRTLVKEDTLGSYSDNEQKELKGAKKPRGAPKPGLLARAKETRPGEDKGASSSGRDGPGLPDPVNGSQLSQLDGAAGQYPKPGEEPTLDALVGLGGGESGGTTEPAQLSQLSPPVRQLTPPSGQLVASQPNTPNSVGESVLGGATFHTSTFHNCRHTGLLLATS